MVRFLSLLALGLTSCSTPPLPPLAASHPASAKSPAGLVYPVFSGLRKDAATQATKKLLSEEDASDSIEQPKNMPMKMPAMPMNMPDMQMDNMPGMSKKQDMPMKHSGTASD